MLQFRILQSAVNILILGFVFVTCQSNESNQSRDYITSLTNKLDLLSQNTELILNLVDYVDQLQERIDVINSEQQYRNNLFFNK